MPPLVERYTVVMLVPHQILGIDTWKLPGRQVSILVAGGAFGESCQFIPPFVVSRSCHTFEIGSPKANPLEGLVILNPNILVCVEI